tara:strand:+ start:244 stop:1251 length:1008 start_codon:yes stop_codon:yes gene_type:complete
MSRAREIADLGGSADAGGITGRNLVINGAMKVSQRGTSFTADGYSLDRWYHQLSGGTSTTTQETFSLGSEVAGFSKYLKQATSTGNNYCGLIHKVEDVKSLPEGKATFSFYAKGTNPAGGSYTVRLARISRVSPYSTDSTPLSSTVTLTSSWQRFVYTFDVPSFSGLGTVDNTSHLYISIHQADGDTGTAAWELNLTGVQLEVGQTATPFEHEDFGTTLAKCQRYYVKFEPQGSYTNYAFGSVTNGTTAEVHASLPVTMRDEPVIETSATLGNFRTWDGGGGYTVTSINQGNYSNLNVGSINVGCSGGGMTTGRAVKLQDNGVQTGNFIAFKAEL